ncbi:Myomegalin [Bagarius yarrelli]|uniref:Myomegalin n=1 Tax=Bagarius yarrelli TaxID=175774 RepID=A0A556U6P3_BAGYA|nr:Myomegalin [Bagarius yarrelli]
MVESVETGDDAQAVSQTQRHANKDRRTDQGAMAPLWRFMVSKSSPLYRSSLFSFSLWESQVQERELVLLRRQVERERRTLQHRIEKLPTSCTVTPVFIQPSIHLFFTRPQVLQQLSQCALLSSQAHGGTDSGAQVKPLMSDHVTSQHAFQHSSFANPNMIYGPQQKRESFYNDVSSSSSGYQSGTRHTGAPTNIYIQGLDSVSQLSNEVRVLREDNQALQSQLQQASRDAEQLRDAMLLQHTRLKQADLEAEKWAGQFGQLQAQLREQTQAVLQLKQEKQMGQENANRLQHEVHVLQQQLSESSRLVQTLQCELQIYQRLRSATHNDSEASPLSPPVRDAGLVNPASSVSAQRQSSVPVTPRIQSHQAEVSDGTFISTGSHVMGHWDDFSILQQQLLEGKMLICEMEASLQNSVEIHLHEGRVSNMLTSTKTLKGVLKKMCSVLDMFWKAAPPSEGTAIAQQHKEEVVSLRHKLAEQEKTLRDTLETLKDSNRTKDSMEQFIFSQLSRTRDVLKKARTNLEVR